MARRTRCVEVDVDLDDWDDEDILEEAVRRKLVPKPPDKTAKEAIVDPRALAVEVQDHLNCRRYGTAAVRLRELLGLFVPPQLIAALEALNQNDTLSAICELDRYIEPSPAATATTLAKVNVASKTEMAQ